MNAKVREAIEKAAQDMWDNINQEYPVMMHAKTIYKNGAEFGFNLALQHASVLREALEDITNGCNLDMEKTNGDAFALAFNLKALKALEQFDKITKDETTGL